MFSRAYANALSVVRKEADIDQVLKAMSHPRYAASANVVPPAATVGQGMRLTPKLLNDPNRVVDYANVAEGISLLDETNNLGSMEAPLAALQKQQVTYQEVWTV